MNLLVMSLVSAAALSFSSCSSNDDLTGGGAGNQSQVKGFYMTLAVQTPTSNGTRTSIGNSTEDATAVEAAVKSGTFYLVDEKGTVVFSKTLTATDWAGASGAIKDPATAAKDGKTTLQIQVENVAAGATYKVYFKAGSTAMDGVTEPVAAGTTGIFTATGIEKTFTAAAAFDKTCAGDNNFSMFNQNDKSRNGNAYTVTFEDGNKVATNPAKVKYNNAKSAIKIERVTARVDVPSSTEAIEKEEYPANASQALKNAIDDAKKKVTKIELVRYALSNVTNKTYVMQNWNVANNVWSLDIPTDATLSKTKDDFGTKYLLKDGGFKAFEGATNDYIFENNKEDATAMYFEYKVTLDANQFKNAAGELMPADFTDGTFYRYNNVIYTSFDQIMKAYKEVAGLFNKQTAEQLRNELTEAKTAPAAETEKSVETKLADFRDKYGIEVFNEGKTYYKQVIKDNQLDQNVIQRNTIYRLQVNKIFNVGAQVPNGEIDKNGLFYLDVTVTVNPWVLNVQGVELGD